MASGGGRKKGGGMCLAWDVGVLARGRRPVVEGNAPSLCGGASSLRGGCVISSAPGCGSWASLRACASPWEMQSGCDGASRMASCRDDGGGGGGCVRPCPGWVPSWSFDSAARPWTLRDCDEAIAVCSGSYHVNDLALPWSMDGCGCRCRWCDVSRNPSQRVAAPVTKAWGRRQCALVDVPSPFPYPQ